MIFTFIFLVFVLTLRLRMRRRLYAISACERGSRDGERRGTQCRLHPDELPSHWNLEVELGATRHASEYASRMPPGRDATKGLIVIAEAECILTMPA